MTLSWFEQSAEGEVLEWRPHLLSPEMEIKGKPHLAYEPSWRERDSLKGKILDVRLTLDGVTWTWGEWTRLKLDLFIAGDFLDLGPAKQRLLSTSTRTIAWEKLPPCDTLELTPSDASGASGPTVQVHRPSNQPWIPFEFRYVSEPRHGLDIVPRRMAWLDRMELSAVGLEQIRHGEFRRKTPVGLRRDGGFLSLTHGFEGLIAVYGCVGKLRRLLDCTTVSELDERGRPKEPGEWDIARKQVSCSAFHMRPWPRRSAELLTKIREEGLAAGIPVHQVDDPRNLRGLHRFLVLRACSVPAGPPGKADLRALAHEEDLRTVLSGLTSPQVISSLGAIKPSNSNGRLWVLRNASDPNLAEIVAWAGAAGLSGLEVAKILVRHRQALRRLVTEIRPETTEGQDVARLTQEIDGALIGQQDPKDLAARVADLEARAKDSRERKPSAADKPPITVNEYAVWKEAVRQAQQWRARVDSVLTYCESGDWTENPAPGNGELLLGPLAERARSLPAAVELPGRERSAADAGRLSSLLKEVFDHAGSEPPSGDKQAILSRLEKVVRPDPGRWATVHHTLRDAAELAQRRPKLAEELGATRVGAARDLGERARRALLFLELDRELREVARQWRGGVARLVSGGDVEALLATPGHPAIQQAHQECLRLAKRLEREGSLPQVPPTAPRARTPEAFRRWWRQLEELFATLGRLQEDLADLEKKIHWAREELVKRARLYLEKYSALPADRRPPELEALDEATRALMEGDGVSTRQAYTRFREVFAQVEIFDEQR